MTAFLANATTDQKLNQLRAELDSLKLQGQLVLPREPVAPETVVGSAVYWDATGQRFAPAQAVVDPDVSTGLFEPGPTADVIGIVSAKYGRSIGDILVLGYWAPTTMPSVVDNGDPGRYYLSGGTAGGWTNTRPAVARPIGLVLRGPTACDSRPRLFVAPLLSDWSHDHNHYDFTLTALPAGDHNPPEPYNTHTITNPDPDEPGWLPAGHAAFGGHAPVGAKFGYNLDKHPELKAVWPPQPLAGVVLEAISDFEPTRLMGRVPPEYVKFDQHGIWWMTDGHGHVPWPVNYDTIAPDAEYEIFSTPNTPPVSLELRLSFVKSTLSSVATVVTSLRPAAGSAITVKNTAGVDATVGDLQLNIDLELAVDAEDASGHQVIKDFTGSKFNRGPVVEGLLVGSPGVVLQSLTTKTVQNSEDQDVTLYMGQVEILLASDAAVKELFPHISVVGDAVERIRYDLPYLALPAGKAGKIIFRFHVPTNGLGEDQLQMQFRAVLFGTSSGAMDELDCTYRRIRRPGGAAVTINQSAVNLPGFVTGADVVADTIVEKASELFDIAAGDTVIITISRTPGAYAGEIGFVRTSGVIA